MPVSQRLLPNTIILSKMRKDCPISSGKDIATSGRPGLLWWIFPRCPNAVINYYPGSDAPMEWKTRRKWYEEADNNPENIEKALEFIGSCLRPVTAGGGLILPAAMNFLSL